MTDVLSAAYSYHARLKSELHRIEEFLRFAQELERRNAARQAVPARQSVASDSAQAIQAGRHAAQPATTSPVAKPAATAVQCTIPQQADRPAPRASLFRGAFAAVGPVEEQTAA